MSVCKSIMQYLAQRKCLRNHSQYFSFLSIIWSQVYHVSSHPQSQHTLYTCPLHFDIPAINFCYLVGLRQRLWRVVLGETTCCDSSQYMKQTRFGWSQNIGDLPAVMKCSGVLNRCQGSMIGSRARPFVRPNSIS